MPFLRSNDGTTLHRAGVAIVAKARQLFTEYTSESYRVGNLGPGLFACIFLAISAAVLCCISGFVEKPKVQFILRIAATVVIVLPTLFFSLATYESNADTLSENREYDNSYSNRVLVVVVCFVGVIIAIVFRLQASAVPLQGRMVRGTDRYGPRK